MNESAFAPIRDEAMIRKNYLRLHRKKPWCRFAPPQPTAEELAEREAVRIAEENRRAEEFAAEEARRAEVSASIDRELDAYLGLMRQWIDEGRCYACGGSMRNDREDPRAVRCRGCGLKFGKP